MDETAVEYFKAVLVNDDSAYAFQYHTHPENLIVVEDLDFLSMVLDALEELASEYGCPTLGKLTDEAFVECLSKADVELVSLSPRVHWSDHPRADYHDRIRADWLRANP